MRSKEIVTILFNFFYLKAYGQKSFLSEREEKMVDNFLKKIHKNYNINGIGKDFFVDYLSYAWNYWIGKSIGKTKRRVSIGWIVGKKMYEKWKNRKIETYQFSYQVNLYDRLNINKQDLLNELTFVPLDSKVSELSEAEELEKKRFPNDDLAQLYHCSLHTSMYNLKSKICLLCKQNQICKKIKAKR